MNMTLRSVCASSFLVAAMLVCPSEVSAHGLVKGSGYSAEHDGFGGCGRAQQEAKDAIEAFCKRLPKDNPAVGWWGPYRSSVERCSQRPGKDWQGKDTIYYRANWSVSCGPHGDRDHSKSYHDPNDLVGPDHSH